MKTLLKTIGFLSLLGLTACSGELIPSDADTPANAMSTPLERHFQQVKRYDCKGSLVSDKIETVKSPTRTLLIVPQSTAVILDSDIENRTTRSSGPITNFTKFTIDYSYGFFNMHVVSGINELYYKFTFTDGTFEEGRRFINVSYSETNLPGFLEFYPAPDDCSPQP